MPIPEAIECLNMRLFQAEQFVRAMGAYLCGQLIATGVRDARSMITDLEAVDERLAATFAEHFSCSAEPNPSLLEVIQFLRAIERPFRVIEGDLGSED